MLENKIIIKPFLFYFSLIIMNDESIPKNLSFLIYIILYLIVFSVNRTS